VELTCHFFSRMYICTCSVFRVFASSYHLSHVQLHCGQSGWETFRGWYVPQNPIANSRKRASVRISRTTVRWVRDRVGTPRVTVTLPSAKRRLFLLGCALITAHIWFFYPSRDILTLQVTFRDIRIRSNNILRCSYPCPSNNILKYAYPLNDSLR